MKIFPSLISGDILNIERMILTFDDKCDGYHIDVMDDHFVPNLTWGPVFINAIGKSTCRPLHIHLMVSDPEKWLDRITLKKTDTFIFHHESFFHVDALLVFIKKLRKLSCAIGVAVDPSTPIKRVTPYLSEIDHLLLMSVKPGFSGQEFMPEVLEKVGYLVEQRERLKANFSIGMDGGIGLKNIKTIADFGVDCVGIASAIFAAHDPIRALAGLYEQV
ncbi:ribulose-phosphate 3-epimerase [Candidatus Dependentiae bacterium]|nr:ribulose-phosphate 3-epimerase [Candidatus Dependentiae bacterium]